VYRVNRLTEADFSRAITSQHLMMEGEFSGEGLQVLGILLPPRRSARSTFTDVNINVIV